MIGAEWIRLGLLFPIGKPIEKFIRSFVDSRDQGIVVLSHIYLLLACALPLWATGIAPTRHELVSFSGLISVGIGDAVVCLQTPPSSADLVVYQLTCCLVCSSRRTDRQASFIGIYFGQRKWKGSAKTIEGSAAAIVAMIGVSFGIAWVAQQPLTLGGSLGVVVSCILAGLMEAFTTQHDNLILPLFFDACLSLTLCNYTLGDVSVVSIPMQ
jgi:dolichol kinase